MASASRYKPHGLGVGNVVFQPEAEKTHERQPVADQELHLVVAEVVERLKDQHLEHDNLVPRLAAGLGLAGLGGDTQAGLFKGGAQGRAEVVPGDQLVQAHQRVGLGVQAVVAAGEVEETGLVHRESGLRTMQPGDQIRVRKESGFLEVPVN